MKKVTFIVALLGLMNAHAQYQYPNSKKVEVSDTYFGTTVNDSYRWLEDIKNPEVLHWFKTQADYTNVQVAKIPNQDKLLQELKDYDAVRYVWYEPITKAGDKYFYQKRQPGGQVAILYYRQNENGKEILLFDPQHYIEGKTFDYSIDVNDDGSKLVLNLSESGSELGDIRVLDVATGRMLPDIIPHSRGAFAGGSNTDILYGEAKNYDTHDPENMLNKPYKLHVLGTPVEKDIVLVSSKKNPELNILPGEEPMVSVYKNSPYIIMEKYTVDPKLTLYYAPKSELKKDKIDWKPLTTAEDEIRSFFVYGTDVYFLTARGNPLFKIIKTSFENPNLATATSIAEGDNEWQISPALIWQTKDGPGNIPEFGTVTIEEEFKGLLEMDFETGVKYPAQLITTGFNDPRVESYIPAKFAAKMQAENGSENPVFLYVDYASGHFGGSTLEEQLAQTAKEYSFLLWQCGDPAFQVQ